MPLKIIGAGFGRTGTLSTKAALEQLGFRSHHMIEVFPNGRQLALWHDVATGKTPDWDAIYADFDACVDFPSAGYYRALMVHFPDAKVLLNTRDPDKWYASASNTIYALSLAIPTWTKWLIPRIRRIDEMVNGAVWTHVFKDRFEDETFAKQVFNQHIADVKAHVPEDRLLEFDVKQGWAPLCAFLECEVPDEPFPHLNDSNSFLWLVRLLKMLAILPYVVAAGLAVYLALRAFG